MYIQEPTPRMPRLLLAALWVLLAATLPAAAAPSLDITIEGLPDTLREAVLAQLSLKREQGHPLLTEPRIRILHARAPDEIRQALQPFGYYRAEVDAELHPQNGGFLARYRVRRGPPVRIGNVDVAILGEGTDDPAFEDWREDFPLKPGNVLLHEPYEQAKSTLLATARRRGYFDAELTERRIEVRLAENRADVTLRFATGPRYRFGEVSFPEVPLNEELLRRYIPFKPGDPFDIDQVLTLQRALADSDYFQQVDVLPQPERAVEQRVPIAVELTMKKANRYTFGVGYGTDTGPRGTIGFERRWANRRGHRIGAELTASDVLTEVTMRYRIPMKNPNTDYLGFTGDWTAETTDVSSRETSVISAAFTGFAADWQRTVSLNYQEERFTVADTTELSTMLYPAVGWQRIEADDRLVPNHGWRLILTAKGAWEQVASSTDLAQGQIAFKHVTTALGGRLISRVDGGASETSDFDKLPVSLRFFAGGDRSVRGYAYNSLGPEEDGEVVGGKHLLAASVEYDKFFTERWGAAVFLDEGNAFNTSDFTLNQGAGVGLRYKLPFGVIRVDVAQAISLPSRPWRLHLTIGPEL